MAKNAQTRDVFERVGEADDSGQLTESRDIADDFAGTPVEVAEPDMQSGDTVEADVPEDHQTSRGSRQRVITAVIGVLLIGFVGVSGFLGWRIKQLDDVAAAGQAAQKAARSYAATLTTMDANDIDKHYQEALDGATGQFKDEYGQGSAQLRQVLIDNKAAGRGIVIDAAVKSATKKRVEVLLFVDQSVSNAVNPSPRIDRSRVQMTMDLVDGRWLASKVELV